VSNYCHAHWCYEIHSGPCRWDPGFKNEEPIIEIEFTPRRGFRGCILLSRETMQLLASHGDEDAQAALETAWLEESTHLCYVVLFKWRSSTLKFEVS
jgi:hypothetical protein